MIINIFYYFIRKLNYFQKKIVYYQYFNFYLKSCEYINKKSFILFIDLFFFFANVLTLLLMSL